MPHKKLSQAHEMLLGRRPLLLEMSAMDDEYEPRKPYCMIGNVAVIDVCGTLTNADYSWRGSTYASIQEEVNRAAEWEQCKGILLCINSPGGETDNAFETADAIEAAAKVKPIWAVAAVNCYSAAYLIGCAADRLFVSPKSGGVGSIGVYCAHVDYSEMLAKEGIAVTLVSAGKGKTDANPYEPLDDAAKAKLQAEVDRLYAEFYGAVARRRKMSEESLRKMGAVLLQGAAAAIGGGLADASATFDEALEQFQAKLNSPPITNSFAAASADLMKGGHLMAELEKPDAVAAPVTAPVTAPAQAAGNPITPEMIAEVNQLCKMVSRDELSGTMIADLAAGKSMSEIRTALINAKADAAGAEVRSNPMPHTGTETKVDPKNGPLMKAVAALGEGMAA